MAAIPSGQHLCSPRLIESLIKNLSCCRCLLERWKLRVSELKMLARWLRSWIGLVVDENRIATKSEVEYTAGST